MHRTMAAIVMAALAASAPTVAEELVLPVFAWQLAGKGGNLWSSELHVTNPGGETRLVTIAGLLPGRIGLQTPCLSPVGPLVVPPYSTVVRPAAAVAHDLSCPTFAVGALRLESDGPLRVTSRMVNERTRPPGGSALLIGFGQEIAAVPAAGLVPADSLTMLPGIAWHPNACGPRLFESYLHFANPGDDEVVVTLMQDARGTPGRLIVNGVEVATPREVRVGAGSWVQLKVDPVDSPLAACLPPTVADLFFTADGPVAAVASVVDRTTQDPRTVVPTGVDR